MAVQSKVIIFGIGGFAELVTAFLNKETGHSIAGYCIEKEYRKHHHSFNRLPLVDFEKLEETHPPSDFQLFIAIGNNYVRERIFTEAKQRGYSMISHITKSVLRWDDLKVGENVLISGSSSLQPLVTVGDNTFIIGSKIGHHCNIGNHILLSCTTLGGHVTIGDYSFLGLNSAVQHKTSIAEKNIIGMGCNIERNTQKNEVYSGGKATKKRVISTEQIKYNYM